MENATISNSITPAYHPTLGVYIHIPFCLSRCHYCGFITNLTDPSAQADYVEALIKEIKLWKIDGLFKFIGFSPEVDTIYLGGGTPLVIGAQSISRILQCCGECFSIVEHPEITVEINPGNVDPNELGLLKESGVNRVSLGIQSFKDSELKFMNRPHSAEDGVRAYEDLRSTGFTNISIDLIAGLPGQTMGSLKSSLSSGVSLAPEHISVYLLEVKSGTVLKSMIDQGRLDKPEDDLPAEMYEETCRFLRDFGYQQYEISNFARSRSFSRHNLKYWSDDIYVGLGAGAHGMTGRHRYSNVEDLHKYRTFTLENRLPIGALSNLSPDDRFREALIMGLRLVKGVDLNILGLRYGINAFEFIRETVGEIDWADLYEWNGDSLFLTAKGRLLSNQVFSRLV